MSKILHSFTLHERASKLIKARSKKGEMSDNVSKAIVWYFTEPKWAREYDEDGFTGKLIQSSHGVVIAPFERKKMLEVIGMLNNQIDELKAESKALKDNRFKFWKKLP